MENAFRSARLVYRAPEESDNDLAFINEKITLDPVIQAQSACLDRPGRKKHAENYLKYIANDTLLGVVICLRGEPMQDGGAKPTHIPIGVLNLGSIGSRAALDRYTEIAIVLAKDYQGRATALKPLTGQWIGRSYLLACIECA